MAFNYVEQTHFDLTDGQVSSLNSNEQIMQRLAYSQDKVKNIERLKGTIVKEIFGCIEGRNDMTIPHVTLQVIHVSGNKEMFIKVNTNQPISDILRKCCKRLNLSSELHELVYDNSTMDITQPANFFKGLDKIYLLSKI